MPGPALTLLKGCRKKCGCCVQRHLWGFLTLSAQGPSACSSPGSHIPLTAPARVNRAIRSTKRKHLQLPRLMQPSTVQNMVLQAHDYRMMGMDGSDGRNPMVSGNLPSLDTELLVREARPGKRQKTHILSIQVSMRHYLYSFV